jgi:hypothetical protein
MMHETHGFDRAAFMDRLFEGIKDEPGMRGAADSPANDLSGIGVNDEGKISEPFLGCDIGEV